VPATSKLQLIIEHILTSNESQYQFCFAQSNGNDNCTDLGGLPDYFSSESHPGASAIQLAAIENLITTSYLFEMSSVGTHLRMAEEFGNEHVQYPLPKDNWVQEITYWEQYIWSQIQIALANYAIGPAVQHPQAERYVKTNTTDGQKHLCGMQKMRSPGGLV
jgi:hypothetical protein